MLIGRQRPAWEKYLVALLVLISMGFSIAIYAKRDRVFKQKLMMNELVTMRNLMLVYYMDHKKFPKDLEEIVKSSIDPFGHAYYYDDKKGWVASQTPGYIDW